MRRLAGRGCDGKRRHWPLRRLCGCAALLRVQWSCATAPSRVARVACVALAPVTTSRLPARTPAVWRRSTLFVIAVMQIVSIIFAALDASAVNGQTARAALAVIAGDGTGFESSCTTTCTAQGASDQAAYDTVCPVACSGATTLMQAQVTTALATNAARYPASCMDVVTAAGDVDKLRVGVDALHAVALSLSLIMILAASCNWQDHTTSAKCVVVSFVLRVCVPYVTSIVRVAAGGHTCMHAAASLMCYGRAPSPSRSCPGSRSWTLTAPSSVATPGLCSSHPFCQWSSL